MEIHLDYATFNFDSGCMDMDQAAISLLGSENHDLRWSQKGLNENSLSISPYGLSWLNNSGYAPRPHRLQVSGLGCENFFYTLPQLVVDCNKKGGECSFSRLDFAFDVIIKKEEWKNFICSAFASSLNSDRDRKRYTLAGSGEAMTIYIGSRTSPRFFRIYNKTLEDKNYKFRDDGKEIPVPDDSFVIRYEVELKRKLWNRDGKKVVVDPSPLFYDYYSGEQSLADYIKSLWLDFGDEILLPPDFANTDLQLYSKLKILFNITRQNAVELTEEEVYRAPYSFDHIVNYVVEKFGKYIPFIVSDRMNIRICEDKCKAFIGFLPQYDIDFLIKPGTYEIDENDEVPLPWSDDILSAYEQIEFIKSDEKEV